METTRASFLANGARGGLALVAGGSLLAVAEGTALGATTKDADIAKLAATAELLAIDFYGKAIRPPQVHGRRARLPGGRKQNERAHYKALAGVLEVGCPEEPELRLPGRVLQAPARSQAGMALETAFVGAYLGAVDALKVNELKGVAALVGANESRHLSVLSNIAAGTIVAAPAFPKALTAAQATAAVTVRSRPSDAVRDRHLGAARPAGGAPARLRPEAPARPRSATGSRLARLQGRRVHCRRTGTGAGVRRERAAGLTCCGAPCPAPGQRPDGEARRSPRRAPPPARLCLLAFVPAFALSFAFHERIVELLARPLPEGKRLVTLGVTEPFTTSVKVSLMAALALTLPIVLSQVWAFFAPALTPSTQRAIGVFVALAAGLFAAGVLFAYSVVLSRALTFLLGFDEHLYEIQIRASYYYSFAALTLLASGLAFQLPIAILGLVRVGALSAAKLRRNRRIAYVALVSFAILLPTVDRSRSRSRSHRSSFSSSFSVVLAAVLERRWAAATPVGVEA